MYFLLGVKSKKIIAKGNHKASIIRQKNELDIDEPIVVVKDGNIPAAMQSDDLDVLRQKYYIPATGSQRVDETTDQFHRRLGAKLRELYQQGNDKSTCLQMLGVSRGLFEIIRYKQGISFAKRAKQSKPEEVK